MMHRKLAISLLMFWLVAFGGLAYVAVSGLGVTPVKALAYTFDGMPFDQLSASMMMIVAALFGWAVLALVTDEVTCFREVEATAYAAGLVALSVILVASLAKPADFPGAATVMAATLAVSAASSWAFDLERKPQPAASDMSRHAARRMAIVAAHNSMLSRVSGRGAPVDDGRI
jgi:hypothetical protein